ncbi:probable bifunctional methylthioribulose-1-phosphate dehydratase/enolase-phosphatase E1 2 isoform X2 [Pistacia vera]|uniref:probable bifunctional methylthioribulose-1-phosphate dehydratase/enolase-phosphatase E1 2 isoform X2 n=1 Tax=Pistacia vera TaxID=55513 RepID=UPI0012631C0E|nr:probable bifunctional methylthioribulose-1-phosphate dehydratase/enolase-phosphatase E1 2 isoform X2 [Pistacia vera]
MMMIVLLKKMLPPPVRAFQTREDLLKHVRDFALTQGYMISIKDSSRDRYVSVSCDRGGVYRKRLKTGENMRQRKTPSRLTNCPFKVVGKEDHDVWALTIKSAEHSHEPSKEISDHPSCRRFTEEEVLTIREMTDAGKKPRQILKALRKRNPSLVSDSRNVYNVKAKIRREILSGKKMEPSTSSSTAINAVNGATKLTQPHLQNGLEVTGSSPVCMESKTVGESCALAAELCRHFYTLGWVSGTGGSITIKVHDDAIPRPHQLIVMSPSGVQKERMVAEDMYVLSSDGFLLSSPPLKPYPHRLPKCTDCGHIFMKVYEICDAGAVIHSHGIEACLVTMMNPFSKEFRISAYPKATAVLVRNHGVYIWGDSWISAKTQAECYHYLFDAAIKLHQLGLDWSTPTHGPIHNIQGVWGCGVNLSRALKAGSLTLDYVIEPSQCCVLLNIEGTMTPLSFVSNILFSYAHGNVEKHLAATFDSEETQDDIHLLRSQIQNDLDQGVAGAVAVPPDYVGQDLVIPALVANVEAMIRADRKVIALKQLQGHIWRTGFQNNELVGILYDDVPEVLERWHAAGIKVYIYSNCSREAQRLLFAKSNYGDLRKYFCGFFDTVVGNKNESHSYLEILRTVGVDRPADMLFVTDVFQEAVAASAAGLEVIISIRPGNGALPDEHGFRTVESLLDT